MTTKQQLIGQALALEGYMLKTITPNSKIAIWEGPTFRYFVGPRGRVSYTVPFLRRYEDSRRTYTVSRQTVQSMVDFGRQLEASTIPPTKTMTIAAFTKGDQK